MTALAAEHVREAANSGAISPNDTESFYRLYGDTVGNGHDVNATDTNTFLAALNTKSAAAAFLA
jgi:hypothetical protein